ncbi:MAG: hypothetical protein DRQ98_01415 [Gammaproteobacteria bacterium]|nr:MAG: hypothetical protein DRQ98_01415 [Gammaproteobacteria bacterium]
MGVSANKAERPEGILDARREQHMNTQDERFFLYSALLILCCTASIFVGLVAGLWSFVQIVAVIELMYWIGTCSGVSTRSW